MWFIKAGFVQSSQFKDWKVTSDSLYVKYHSRLCCAFTGQVLNQDLEELPKAHYTVSREGLTSACIHYMEKRSTRPFPLYLLSCDNSFSTHTALLGDVVR